MGLVRRADLDDRRRKLADMQHAAGIHAPGYGLGGARNWAPSPLPCAKTAGLCMHRHGHLDGCDTVMASKPSHPRLRECCEPLTLFLKSEDVAISTLCDRRLAAAGKKVPRRIRRDAAIEWCWLIATHWSSYQPPGVIYTSQCKIVISCPGAPHSTCLH